MSYQIHVVKEAAKGHWREIFGALAPQLNEAVDRAPNHVSCPVPAELTDFGFSHTGRKPGPVFAIRAELITTVLHYCNGLRAGHSMRR